MNLQTTQKYLSPAERTAAMHQSIMEIVALHPAAKHWLSLIERDGIHRFDIETAIKVKQDLTHVTSPRYAMSLNFNTIAERRTPSLIAIARYGSEDTALDLLYTMLSATVRFFNVAGNMSDEQIEETACIVFDGYRTLSLDDCALCLKRAKSGQYGKVYDRLDGSVILGWFEQYTSERNDAIEQMSIKAHAEKKAEKTVWSADDIAKLRSIIEAAQERAQEKADKEKDKKQQDKIAFWAQRRAEAQEKAARFVGAENAYWENVYKKTDDK